MFSTHKLPKLPSCALGVLASAGMVLSTGCQRIPPNRPAALNDEPLIVDEAMQIRDWDRSTAYYGNGNTHAGATRLTFEPKNDNRYNYAADPLIGVANIVLIPFTYFRTPARTMVIHQGAIVPPTHTAMPPTRVIE